MLLLEMQPFTEDSKHTAVTELLEASIPDRDFYILVASAALFALFGIVLDSIPVLIGAMIVAPLASPILALGLGISVGDMKLVTRSAGSLLVACVLSALVVLIVAEIVPPFSVNGTFISFTAHPGYDIAIALIAGIIAAYGYVRPKVGGAFTGVGVAISLMPPLVVIALSLAAFDFALLRESSLIFLLNVAGILIGSTIVFALFGIRKHYHHMRTAVSLGKN